MKLNKLLSFASNTHTIMKGSVIMTIILMVIYFTIGGLMMLSAINNYKGEVNIWSCVGFIIGGILWPGAIVLAIRMNKSEAK